MKGFRTFVFVIIMLILYANVFLLAADQYDAVILNGSVYDTRNKDFLDNYNIGIKNGKIDTITRDPISGNITVDATDKIVMPAFIDSLQRHYGNAFEEVRLFDGVASSIFITEESYDSFMLNNENGISHINRVLLKDITNLYAIPSQEQAYTDFRSKVAASIAEGFAGFYIKPRTIDNIDINFVDELFPLYLDLDNIPENSIIQFLNLLVEKNNTKRNIHLVSVNKFFSIIDKISDFVNKHENFTMGGYPFSYISTIPNKESASYLNPLVNNLAINKDNKSSLIFENKNFQDNYKYSIVGALKQDTIYNLVSNPKFTSESYDRLPGAMMTTQDANTFMGRILISSNNGLLPYAVLAQTESVKKIFNAIDSPFLNKGYIEVGSDADILVMDLKSITPHSSIADISHKSSGITEMFREGVLLIKNGELKENLPKARWLKRSVRSFELLDDFKIKTRGKNSKKIDAINYNKKLYIPIKDVFEYLGLLYEENSGTATLGDLIRINIGSNSFSVGTNKSQMDLAPILINNGIYVSQSTLETILNGFFELKFSSNIIDIKKDLKASLLEAPLNDNEINISINRMAIIYVYIFSALILILFISCLNINIKKQKNIKVKKERKNDERL